MEVMVLMCYRNEVSRKKEEFWTQLGSTVSDMPIETMYNVLGTIKYILEQDDQLENFKQRSN